MITFVEIPRETGSVLVTAAFPQELRDFRTSGNDHVACLTTGKGRKAGQGVRQRLAEGGVQLVVSAGFAGGARPGFEVGDLVMASEVIHASSGERRRPDPSFFRLNGMASVGPFVTVDRVLSEPAEKSEVGSRFGAIAVDMETSVVAQAAEQAGVAWTAVRAILDPMEFSLKIRSWSEALRCIAAPRRWMEFSHLLRTVRTASRSLADGLNLLVERRQSDGSR